MARRTLLTIREGAIAYSLNVECGYTQSNIAKLMGVSQSTVSNMIKEFTYQRQIHDLEEELAEARMEIKQHNVLPNTRSISVDWNWDDLTKKLL